MMFQPRARAALLAISSLSLALGTTESGGAAGGPAQRHESHRPPSDEPGDDDRMSGMGRLARSAATGRLEKRIAKALEERASLLPHEGGDEGEGEGEGPAGGQAETSIAVDASGQHIVVGINDTRGFAASPVSVSGFSYSDDGGATFVDGGRLPV